MERPSKLEGSCNLRDSSFSEVKPTGRRKTTAYGI